MTTQPRMTMQTLAVLKVLLDDPAGDHYGLEICRAAGLKSGSLYPILARLEQAGWLEGSWEDIDQAAAGRRRRRYYRLTSGGAELARTALNVARRQILQGSRPIGQPRTGEASA
jgi:PadR family transcriptional regulator, regulatory protein PadR